MPQSERIMFTETFHVAHLEPAFFGIPKGGVDRHQLAIRKNVTADKVRSRRAGLVCADRDSMVEENSAWAQLVPGMLEVERQLAFAHVLKHADTYKLFETLFFIQVAIITNLHAALLLQAGSLYSLIGEHCLFFAESDAESIYPVLSSSVNHKAAPS